jgi:hypothetical protein
VLTTLKNAKTLLKIPLEDDTEDGFLLALLSASSAAIEDYCNRSFKLQEYSGIKCDGVHGKYLLLPNYPIQSVALLQFGSSPEFPDNYEIDPDRGMLYRSCGWPCGERSITVTYTAGYVLPSDAPGDPASTLPEPLEMACILFAQTLQRMPGVTAERVGDISVSYASNEGEGLPFAVKALINPYRRWA